MKTTDFNRTLSSSQLRENLERQFGTRVNLEEYDREQLEDIRNKLRTRIFQQEGGAGINDLLTNETYQKDKAMLELLNTRIKEMLGENMKKLRDKIDELTEARKPDFPDLDGDGVTTEPISQAAEQARKSGTGGTITTRTDKKGRNVTTHRAGNQYSGAGAEPTSAPKEPKKVDEAKCSECGMYESKCKCATNEGKNWIQQATEKGKGKFAAKAKRAGMSTAAFAKEKEHAPGTLGKEARLAKTLGKLGNKKTTESIEIFKQNVRLVNEALNHLLNEDEEGKAKAITAASDIVNDYTSWMQRVGQYQTKALIELHDDIRAEFGHAEAEKFKQVVGPALDETLDTLTNQREIISNAVAILAGEPDAMDMMGMEPDVGSEIEPSSPDGLNPEMPSDEFGASDAAAGGMETPGREMRESREQRRARKLAEAHSIISKLAK